MRRIGIHILAWLFCALISTPLYANGRFPRAQRLIIDPGDPAHMVLAGTFGLAVTTDAGESWVHVCESAFTDPNFILDPLVAFTQDSSLFTGTAVDLRRSDPGACEFDVVLGQPGELVPDYTIDVDGQTLLALVAGDESPSQFSIQVSADANNWEPLGEPFLQRSALTLDVSPADEQRLYVTALAPMEDGGAGQRGILLRSPDRGQTWQEWEIPGTSFDAQPFIAAMHPTNPDVLYVRLDARKLDDLQLAVADDALLVTKDGGQTWKELVRKQAKLFAFALSPDTSTILAGYGTPDDATVGADNNQYGLYRITDAEQGDGSFTSAEVNHLLQEIPVHCLTWTADRLYVCLKQFEAGFELGVTSDHDFTELSQITPLLLLNHVEGPTSCESGTEAAVCAGLWETDCMRLFACGEDPMGAGGQSGGGNGFKPAGESTGGEDQTEGMTGGNAEPATPASPEEAGVKNSSSCACDLTGRHKTPLNSLLLALGVLTCCWFRFACAPTGKP